MITVGAVLRGMTISAACAAEAVVIAITKVVTKDFIFVNFAPHLFTSTVLYDYKKTL
ncbi:MULTISPECIES: hypothetical protein [unclassified Bartonella]|uniref:hypothetical protein n=1 Tax=unclassified Bartonella TaxID=2645622 RepID=UPI0035D04735